MAEPQPAAEPLAEPTQQPLTAGDLDAIRRRAFLAGQHAGCRTFNVCVAAVWDSAADVLLLSEIERLTATETKED